MPESPQQSQDAPFREGAREAATMQPHRWTAITLGALSIIIASFVAAVITPGTREVRAVQRLRAAGAKIMIPSANSSRTETLSEICEFVLAKVSGKDEFKRGYREVDLTETVPATDLSLTKSLRDVRWLTLRGSQWTDNELVWIADALQGNTGLSLVGTAVQAQGLAALRSGKVEYLRISGHASTNHPANLQEGLIGHLTLKDLHISLIPVNDEFVKPLAGNGSLRNLLLSNAKLSATGVGHILSIQKLRTLILSNAEISQDGLQALADHKGGESLGLARTGITDEDLATLKDGFQWKAVNLSGTKISASGLRALPRLPAELTIHDTGIRVTVEFLDAIEALGCQELGVRYKDCDPAVLRRVGRLPKVFEPPF